MKTIDEKRPDPDEIEKEIHEIKKIEIIPIIRTQKFGDSSAQKIIDGHKIKFQDNSLGFTTCESFFITLLPFFFVYINLPSLLINYQ